MLNLGVLELLHKSTAAKAQAIARKAVGPTFILYITEYIKTRQFAITLHYEDTLKVEERRIAVFSPAVLVRGLVWNFAIHIWELGCYL